MNREIFETIDLPISGMKCDILMIKAGDISRALFKHSLRAMSDTIQQKDPYDQMLFILVESCLFDGKKKDVDFCAELSIDDYSLISDSLADLMKTFNTK